MPRASKTASLSGVACAGSTNCTAVGTYFLATAGTAALIEHWNGSKWSLVTAPVPAGGADGYLSAISCPGKTDCLAVGYYRAKSFHLQNLAEHWNGSEWSTA